MDIDVNQDEQIQVSLQKEFDKIKEDLKKVVEKYKEQLQGIKGNAVSRIEDIFKGKIGRFNRRRGECENRRDAFLGDESTKG